MCRAAFITEVFNFMANPVFGRREIPESQCLKTESVHQPEKIIYISEKKK